MSVLNQQQSYTPWFRLLAGIEAGVLGGLAMAAWFVLSSALLGHSIWTLPNLLGTLLVKDRGLRAGFGAVTLSGLALELVSTGVIGILFSLLVGGIRSRRRVMLLGLVTGLVWFYFFRAVMLRQLGAEVWIYSSPRLLLAAHLIFGVVLGLYPWLLPAGRQPLPGEAPPVL